MAARRGVARGGVPQAIEGGHIRIWIYAAALVAALAAAAQAAQHNSGRPGDWVWGFGQGNLEARTASGPDELRIYCTTGGAYGINGMEILFDGRPVQEPVDFYFSNGAEMRFRFPRGLFTADNNNKHRRFVRVLGNLRGADWVEVWTAKSGRRTRFSLFGSSRALGWCP